MSEEEPSSLSVAIIGAGPAGLTAAYYLLKSVHSDCEVTVLEVDPKYVGGLSKTQEIEDLWNEIQRHDMLVRPRSHRYLYEDRSEGSCGNARIVQR